MAAKFRYNNFNPLVKLTMSVLRADTLFKLPISFAMVDVILFRINFTVKLY